MKPVRQGACASHARLAPIAPDSGCNPALSLSDFWTVEKYRPASGTKVFTQQHVPNGYWYSLTSLICL